MRQKQVREKKGFFFSLLFVVVVVDYFQSLGNFFGVQQGTFSFKKECIKQKTSLFLKKGRVQRGIFFKKGCVKQETVLKKRELGQFFYLPKGGWVASGAKLSLCSIMSEANAAGQ